MERGASWELVDTTLWLAVLLLHRTGSEFRLTVSTKEEPRLGCSISFYFGSTLPSPDGKKKKYFYRPFYTFWWFDLVFCNNFFGIFKKKHHAEQKKKRNRMGHKMSHFKIKLDLFFPKPARWSVFFFMCLKINFLVTVVNSLRYCVSDVWDLWV